MAFAKVREDKEREAGDGFDGTWVAHPGLVPVATEIFDRVLGDRPNQKERQRDDVAGRRADAAARRSRSPGGTITEAGLRTNVSVALQYLDTWLRGTGAAAINNLMEDAATAEISRAQLWQWIRHGATTEDGAADHPRALRRRPRRGAGQARRHRRGAVPRRRRDPRSDSCSSDDFEQFLTLPAYALIWIDEGIAAPMPRSAVRDVELLDRR